MHICTGKPPGQVELDDVMLAIQARSAFVFAQPPDQNEIAQLAAVANDKEMPRFPMHKHGLLIPEDKDSLTAQNYQLGLTVLPTACQCRVGWWGPITG
eukprot:1154443-Pelagomonas_calceolata.AAC.3